MKKLMMMSIVLLLIGCSGSGISKSKAQQYLQISADETFANHPKVTVKELKPASDFEVVAYFTLCFPGYYQGKRNECVNGHGTLAREDKGWKLLEKSIEVGDQTSAESPKRKPEPDPRANTWNTDHLAYNGVIVRSDISKLQCFYDIRINGAEAWWNGDGYTRGENKPYPSDRSGIWMLQAGSVDSYLSGECPVIKSGEEVQIVKDKRQSAERLERHNKDSLRVVAIEQMNEKEVVPE